MSGEASRCGCVCMFKGFQGFTGLCYKRSVTRPQTKKEAKRESNNEKSEKRFRERERKIVGHVANGKLARKKNNPACI